MLGHRLVGDAGQWRLVAGQRRLVGDAAGQRNPGVATRRINARAEQGLSSSAQWSAQARHPALGSFIDAQLVPAVGSHRRRFGPARRGSDRASLGMPRAHVVLHSLLVTRGRHSHGRRRDTLHEPRHPAAHGRTVCTLEYSLVRGVPRSSVAASASASHESKEHWSTAKRRPAAKTDMGWSLGGVFVAEGVSQPAEGTLDTRKRKGRVPCQWCRATPAAP